MKNSASCELCGFDHGLYGHRPDAVSSLRVIPLVLRAAVEDLPEEVAQRRPASDTWSIAEYLQHTLECYVVHRDAVAAGLASADGELPWPDVSPITPESATVDVAAVLDEMETVGAELIALVEPVNAEGPLSEQQWERAGGVGYHVRNVVHEGLHHMVDIGRIRSGFGLGPVAGTGQVTGLFSSSGGVPKLPIDHADVSAAGVTGDSQDDREHHGRPVQAVCLWSADVIAALRAEGHPIAAGNAGENITVEGIEWASLRPGSRIVVGDVPMLITAHAIPCSKNAQWFSDRRFDRILHPKHPGWSRLYAIPLAAGRITIGDPVTPEPNNVHL